MRSRSRYERQPTGSIRIHGADGARGAVWMRKSDVCTKYKVYAKAFMFVFKGKGQKIDTIIIMLSSFTKFSFRENRASCKIKIMLYL